MQRAEPVHYSVTVGTTTDRRLEERLAVRFPAAYRVLTRLVQRLPTGSRVRAALVRRAVRFGTEALNRGDHEATFALWHPACESTFPAQMTILGDEPGTHGRDERIRFQRRWTKGWGAIRFVPDRVADLGDRMLVIGRVRGSGSSSGAAFDSEWAVVVTFESGWVVREQVFLDHAEARAAAGLRT